MNFQTSSGTIEATGTKTVAGVLCYVGPDGSVWAREGNKFVPLDAVKHRSPRNDVDPEGDAAPAGAADMSPEELAEMFGDDASESGSGGDAGAKESFVETEDDDVVPAKRRRRTKAEMAEAASEAARAAESESDS